MDHRAAIDTVEQPAAAAPTRARLQHENGGSPTNCGGQRSGRKWMSPRRPRARTSSQMQQEVLTAKPRADANEAAAEAAAETAAKRHEMQHEVLTV